jgi:hypothetical protein
MQLVAAALSADQERHQSTTSATVGEAPISLTHQ